jgi:hypothetical protein
MTIASRLERIVGEERFARMRSHTFGDTARAILGEERYGTATRKLATMLDIDDTPTTLPGRAKAQVYNALRDLSHETHYEFIVDAIAQNTASLVFILNDKYMAGRSWMGALGTRLNATVGNTIIGRPYGAWQDYVVRSNEEEMERKGITGRARRGINRWGAQAAAFTSGQSWLYAAFLAGGSLIAGDEPEYHKIAKGVLSLTVLSPLLGPFTKTVYTRIRGQFGLETRGV